MFIVGIILLVIAVGCMAWAWKDNRPVIFSAGIFLGATAVFMLLASLKVNISTKQLTGYIYSSSNTAGYTTAHIRFSQNAGVDSQPEFCVKTDSDAGNAIRKYVGSDTKVRVDIPPYFYVANNPFACGTTGTIIKPEAE